MENYQDLIIQIESFRLYFDKLNPHIEIKKNILRNSLLKSARFSSKIEGANSKLEINNLYKAYRYITSKKSPKKLSVDLIKQLHQIVLKDIYLQAGSFRNEPCAIYNTAGVAVYLAPPSQKIKKLLEDLITEINKSKDHPLIKNRENLAFHYILLMDLREHPGIVHIRMIVSARYVPRYHR